jgi:hypothetical protein
MGEISTDSIGVGKTFSGSYHGVNDRCSRSPGKWPVPLCVVRRSLWSSLPASPPLVLHPRPNTLNTFPYQVAFL